jgi:hypothetical protein
VFVDFFPPRNRDADGWVLIEHLADKPSTASLDAWFTEIGRTANLNPQLSVKRSTLNGLPAQDVRYRNADGTETEATYVISGSKTFEISFSGDRTDAVETLPNHPVFLKMRSTFRCKTK